jgi:serine protease
MAIIFQRTRGLLPAGLALLLASCGGGGTSSQPAAAPPPPGLAGTVHSPSFDLGRMVEHEPNDTRAQPHRLPPVSAGARLEVTGLVEAGADEVDAFALSFLSDQDVVLTLTWAEPDGDARLGLAVHEQGASLPLAEAPADDTPRALVFAALAGRTYEVVLSSSVGRAAWVLEVEAEAAVAAASRAVAAPTASAWEPGPAVRACASTHVLVRLRPGGLPARLAERFGLAVGERVGGDVYRLRFPSPIRDATTARIRAFCERLRGDGEVEVAEPDWIVRPLGTTTDAERARQWNLDAIGAPEAWDVTRGDPAIRVGIVDTGLAVHPDLAGQVAAGGYDFISDPQISGDGGGRDPDPTDPGAHEYPGGRSQWHGTHVAGIVAARANDGYGVTGVAPDCRIVPLRAIGRSGGLVSDVADAILYGAGLLTTDDGRRLASPVAVLNLSFGLSVDSSILRTACERALTVGVVLVGASGNDGQAVQYPAAYPEVIAVGAVGASLKTLGYSSFGSEVDLAAPGGNLTTDDRLDGWPDGILSSLLDETVHPRRPAHGYLEGTSQAAPHVAGVAALLLSVDPTLTPARVKSLMTATALDRGSVGKDPAYGWGIVRAHRALRALLDDLGTPLATSPRPWLPYRSLPFLGFDDRADVPVGNGGGGRLVLGPVLAETDDGGGWLTVVPEEDPTGAAPSSVRALEVIVNRAALPDAGCHGGTIWLRDPSGERLASLRVLVYVEKRPFAGELLRVRTIDPASGLPGTIDLASPSFGYRWWMPAVTSGAWKIQAGEDVDGNGFFCGTGDACGWYGGGSEAEATVVEARRSEPVTGLDIGIERP